MGKFKYFIASALIVAISFLLIGPYLENYIPVSWRGYTSKIGEALLIGSIVSFTVDRFLKADLLAEIARDVLRFTVGYDLPERIKEEVKYLLRLPFVRRNFEMKLTITPHQGDPECVKVKMLTCFEVENLSKRKKQYNFTSSISQSTSQIGQSEITRFEMSGKNAFSLDKFEISKQTIVDKHFNKISKKIDLPPRRKRGEGVYNRTSRVLF